MIGQTF